MCDGVGVATLLAELRELWCRLGLAVGEHFQRRCMQLAAVLLPVSSSESLAASLCAV
jgi:hypothetical protein